MWFKLLMRSRKFWLAFVDAVVSTLTVLLTAILSPEHAALALTVVAIWQPVIIALIVGIAWEDVARKNNGL